MVDLFVKVKDVLKLMADKNCMTKVKERLNF